MDCVDSDRAEWSALVTPITKDRKMKIIKLSNNRKGAVVAAAALLGFLLCGTTMANADKPAASAKEFVGLQSKDFGLFLRIDEHGVAQTAPNLFDEEHFLLAGHPEPRVGGQVIISRDFGFFLSVTPDGVVTTTKNAGFEEEFVFLSTGTGSYCILAAGHAHYLRVTEHGELTTTRECFDEEEFLKIPVR